MIDTISDQETISIADGFKIQAIATPEQDLSDMSYIIKDNIFSVDCYIPNCHIITAFPRNNKEDTVASENKIKALIAKQDLIINQNILSYD